MGSLLCIQKERHLHKFICALLVITRNFSGSNLDGWLAWRRHQMETFSALLAICAENSPVPGEFSTQRPVTRSFDVYFDMRPNKRLSKQSWGWWFETLSWSLWRHCNGATVCVPQRQWSIPDKNISNQTATKAQRNATKPVVCIVNETCSWDEIRYLWF